MDGRFWLRQLTTSCHLRSLASDCDQAQVDRLPEGVPPFATGSFVSVKFLRMACLLAVLRGGLWCCPALRWSLAVQGLSPA
jgi:hypothetical protein